MMRIKANFDDIYRNRVFLSSIDKEQLKGILMNKLRIYEENARIDGFLNGISDINHKISLINLRNSLEKFGFSDETTEILENLKREIKRNNENKLSFFDIIDKNKDKKITKNEFLLFFNYLEKTFKKDDIEKLFRRFDLDGDGVIDLNEFLVSLGFGKDMNLTQDSALNDADIKKFCFDLQEFFIDN